MKAKSHRKINKLTTRAVCSVWKQNSLCWFLCRFGNLISQTFLCVFEASPTCRNLISFRNHSEAFKTQNLPCVASRIVGWVSDRVSYKVSDTVSYRLSAGVCEFVSFPRKVFSWVCCGIQLTTRILTSAPDDVKFSLLLRFWLFRVYRAFFLLRCLSLRHRAILLCISLLFVFCAMGLLLHLTGRDWRWLSRDNIDPEVRRLGGGLVLNPGLGLEILQIFF